MAINKLELAKLKREIRRLGASMGVAKDATTLDGLDSTAFVLKTDTRTKLIEDTTFYVSTTGNDTTGDGSVGAPWATLIGVYSNLALNYDFNNFVAIVSMADGSYDPLTNDSFLSPNGQIYFQGNTSDPTAVVIEADASWAIYMASGTPNITWFSDLTVHAAGTYALAYTYGVGQVMYFGANPITGDYNRPVIFSGITTYGVLTENYSYIYNFGAVTITQDAPWAAFSKSTTGSFCGVGTSSLDVTGTTFTEGFLVSEIVSQFEYYSSSTTGVPTGPAYNVVSNSVLTEFSAVPGSLAGTTATGGQVV